MRILVALGGNALPRRDEVASAPDQQGDVEQAAIALADLTVEHEVIVTHDSGPGLGHMLELALRNRLPERDVVSVLTQVVVGGERCEPNAIAEIRSLRSLVNAGALVICAKLDSAPVALNGDGNLHRVEATIDWDLTMTLLARRLDADLLLMLTDGEQPIGRKAKAARYFAARTGRRAAIGTLTDVARVARGDAGIQVTASVDESAITPNPAQHQKL
jgi:carbamate kinase